MCILLYLSLLLTFKNILLNLLTLADFPDTLSSMSSSENIFRLYLPGPCVFTLCQQQPVFIKCLYVGSWVQ